MPVDYISSLPPAGASLGMLWFDSTNAVLNVADGSGNWAPVGMGLTLRAATPAAGVALVNGTPVILTWTAPADGKLHRVIVVGQVQVTGAETGGAVRMTTANPAVTGSPFTIEAGAHAGLAYYPLTAQQLTVQPGETVSITQTALTGGSALLFAEIWAS